jgi:hypothetical protein
VLFNSPKHTASHPNLQVLPLLRDHLPTKPCNSLDPKRNPTLQQKKYTETKHSCWLKHKPPTVPKRPSKQTRHICPSLCFSTHPNLLHLTQTYKYCPCFEIIFLQNHVTHSTQNESPLYNQHNTQKQNTVVRLTQTTYRTQTSK